MDSVVSRKILVVDDEEEILDFLVRTLQRTNCRVISATGGKDAVRLARAERPDLIILDVVMPDMDGGQVASVLKESPKTAKIPIIFLTGILTKEEGFSVATTGERFVIPKPVQPIELLKRISQVLPLE